MYVPRYQGTDFCPFLYFCTHILLVASPFSSFIFFFLCNMYSDFSLVYNPWYILLASHCMNSGHWNASAVALGPKTTAWYACTTHKTKQLSLSFSSFLIFSFFFFFLFPYSIWCGVRVVWPFMYCMLLN